MTILTSKTYVLPDLEAICKWKSGFNPHHEEAKTASSKWVQSFGIFKGKKLQFFLDGGSELLCSYVYCYAGHEQLRTACDFVNFLFTIDEISDDQDGRGARETGNTVLKALMDADYDDGTVLCKMTKEFRNRFVPHCGPYTLSRFMQHSADYVHAFEKEADYREDGTVLDIDAYNALRRENSAVRYCFGLFGYLLGLDLPDTIFYHPVMYRMHLAAVDMVTWSNDLYSYNMEQAMGHMTNNVLTVLQKAEGVDLQGAADLVGAHFEQLYHGFEADKALLPSFGPEMDAVVAQYVMAMETWVAGNLKWSFATRRYFGDEHLEIQKSLTVTLAPQKRWEVKH